MYELLCYVAVRWIHGSITYVIATTAIDRRDIGFGVEMSTLK